MHQLHGQSVDGKVEELASDHRCNNQDNEQDEQGEVQNGVTNRTTSAKLRLLERVDRRTNLATVTTLLAIVNGKDQ